MEDGGAITRLAVALIALIALVFVANRAGSKPYAPFVGVLVFSLLSREIQKRWVLEDRIDELERKMPNRQPESARPSGRGS